MKNSDRDCCYTCNLFVCDVRDIGGRLVPMEACKVTGKEANPWDDACEHFSRVFQGFGE